ncbi:MAG: esterase family protein [Planctomycetes bacterium]|nr:esterase family protein [Planctomycetota bacterium]
MNRFVASFACVAMLLAAAHAKDDYKPGPDSEPQKGVPEGKVEKFRHKSEIFAKTERDVAVYIPAQYDGKTPACVMVFQDGVSAYLNPKGSYRATVVMDNLIHKKEIPVMIGIFINPGLFPTDDPKKKPGSNRSFEYDSLTPQYVTFLEKEIFPAVVEKYKLKLRQDAAGRGICGASSGGICAFTAAWQRPDMFSKVLSHIGSFTNIRGGDVYPGIIRKTEKKNIRVFLQDGSNDLDNAAGNWYLANLQMESAFKFKKYDYKAVWGDGGHTGKHGGAILPDSMRWLWRDTLTSAEPAPKGPEKAEKIKKAEAIPTPVEVAPEVQPRVVRPRLFQGRFRLFR